MEQIDILLATYNGEKYLKEQIESILNQTYSNFRLLISDDCSQDNTLEILKEYEEKDDRVEVFLQEQNLGYVKNFEFLLSQVENEIYALSDQDDIWLDDKLECAVNKLEEENADLYFSDLYLIDQNGKQISDSFWKEKGFYKKIIKDKKYKGLILNNYVTGCTIVSKKQYIKDIIPFPKDMMHDYWIALVTSLKGKIIYDRQPHIKYRQHGNNQIGSKMKSQEMNSLDQIRNMFIDIKIKHFEILIINEKLFNEKEQRINKKALEYFKKLSKKKYINLSNWGLYYKLYKYENFKYYIANFIILNIPILGRFIYKLKKGK